MHILTYLLTYKKNLGLFWLYILITTAPITTVLMATERGKDWVFL